MNWKSVAPKLILVPLRKFYTLRIAFPSRVRSKEFSRAAIPRRPCVDIDSFRPRKGLWIHLNPARKEYLRGGYEAPVERICCRNCGRTVFYDVGAQYRRV